MKQEGDVAQRRGLDLCPSRFPGVEAGERGHQGVQRGMDVYFGWFRLGLAGLQGADQLTFKLQTAAQLAQSQAGQNASLMGCAQGHGHVDVLGHSRVGKDGLYEQAPQTVADKDHFFSRVFPGQPDQVLAQGLGKVVKVLAEAGIRPGVEPGEPS